MLRDLDDPAGARALFEQALASDLKTYGEDDPEVATDRNNLAMVLRDLGDLVGAREMLKQALASDLRTYGEDHADVARDRGNLDLVFQDLGDLPGARIYSSRRWPPTSRRTATTTRMLRSGATTWRRVPGIASLNAERNPLTPTAARAPGRLAVPRLRDACSVELPAR